MLPCGCTVSLQSPPSLTVLSDFFFLFCVFLGSERTTLARAPDACGMVQQTVWCVVCGVCVCACVRVRVV